MPRLFLALLTALIVSGCAQKPTQPQVIATLFPQYNFAQIIGGDKVSVSLLLPPGSEAHSYQPSPQDISSIRSSILFLHSGLKMEPWVEAILQIAQAANVADVSAGVQWLSAQGGVDPHYWLDLGNAQIIARNVLEGLVSAAPEHEEYFQQRALQLQESLQNLDNALQKDLEPYAGRTLIVGGHSVFGYFFKRYGLKSLSAYEGFSPDAEPSPQKIAQLVRALKETKSSTVFYEENIDPKIARFLSEQTGAELLLLHGAHNVSKEELQKNISYVDIMRLNLTNILKGLGQ